MILLHNMPDEVKFPKIGQKPLFFPDATRAVVKTLDSEDIKNTKTPGILVNTYHLLTNPGVSVIKKFGGVRPFMNWKGLCISDSGGFQAMSLGGKPTDKGVLGLTPESSLRAQFTLGTDLMVVLDDFTPPTATYEEAKETVRRTLLWAERSLKEYEKLTQNFIKARPLCQRTSPFIKPILTGVVQGGFFPDLRAECTKQLIAMGYTALGYGGWPLRQAQGKPGGEFDYQSAEIIASNAKPQRGPLRGSDTLLYGLGIGKPHEIKALVKMGYTVFDCVLPTRDARHKRLYVFNADTINNIDTTSDTFYSYYTPDKEKYYKDTTPVSTACDCLLCTNYSKAYLGHLFRINEIAAMRLASIHNLRFYSILMEKLSEQP